MEPDETRKQMHAIPESEADALGALEALLFVAGEAVARRDIATTLGWTDQEVSRYVDLLAETFDQYRRGIALLRHDASVELVSAPRFGPIIERFLSVERNVRLSEAALETLAILAFRQPATRAEIEAIRGVDCSGVLSTLVARELVEVVGRRSAIGNPLEYATTNTFLRQFGVMSLAELAASDED
jgi:segregation and condensation protein B